MVQIGGFLFSFIADKYPVLGPREEYLAKLGLTDERIHFLKQVCAAGSHIFIVDNHVKETNPPRRRVARALLGISLP
jgi:hypothetical protein